MQGGVQVRKLINNQSSVGGPCVEGRTMKGSMLWQAGIRSIVVVIETNCFMNLILRSIVVTRNMMIGRDTVCSIAAIRNINMFVTIIIRIIS